jgi:hypothetical protein
MIFYKFFTAGTEIKSKKFFYAGINYEIFVWVTNYGVNMHANIQSICKYIDLQINIFVFEFL